MPEFIIPLDHKRNTSASISIQNNTSASATVTATAQNVQRNPAPVFSTPLEGAVTLGVGEIFTFSYPYAAIKAEGNGEGTIDFVTPFLTTFATIDPDVIGRYFTTFDAVANSYIELNNVISLSGDFDISVSVATTNTSDENHIIDSTSDELLKVTTNPLTGTVKYLVGNGSNWRVNIDSITSVTDGVLHVIRVTKVGDDYTLYIDGVQEATDNTSLGVTPSNIYIGRRADGANYWDGVIADVLIEDNGTLVLDMPIDGVYNNGDPVVNNADPMNNGTFFNVAPDDSEFFTFESGIGWLGEELFTQSVWENPFNAGADWSFVDNEWVLSGSGSLSPLQLIATNAQPEISYLEGECLAISADPNSGLGVTSANTYPAVTSTGLYTYTLEKSVGTSQLYKRRNGVVNATITKPSFKKLLEVAE